MTLRDRLRLVMVEWKIGLGDIEAENFLDSVEDAVKDWLMDGAELLRKE